MLVGNAMTRHPATVGPDDPLSAAVALMMQRRVRRLPVVNGTELVGILTRSDVLRASPADLNPFSPVGIEDRAFARAIRHAMTPDPVTTTVDTPLEDAASVLAQRLLGALPVMAGEHLAGIITESDIFRTLAAMLGGDEPGIRLTFDVSANEDTVAFTLSLARRHGLRVRYVWTYLHEGQRSAVVSLAGLVPEAFTESLWSTGHRVLSVRRIGPPAPASS